MIPFIKGTHFLDKIPQRKRKDFEERVRGLLEEAFRTAADRNMDGKHWRAGLGGDETLFLSPHNPDWCQAFGLVQGVALMLGFDMWNASVKGSPRQWFDELTREVSRSWYAKIKEAEERGDFEPMCTCGRKLHIVAKCSVCDRDE
jgi:hypothetical protein